MDDLLAEFLAETGDQLEELDAHIVRFEEDPNDAEMLNTIFRVVHTIKGTCGFFDLPRMSALAHAAEALMGHYRDGAPVSAEGVKLILQCLDRFRAMLAALNRDGTESPESDSDLIEALSQAANAAPAEPLVEPAQSPDDQEALQKEWAEELERPSVAVEGSGQGEAQADAQAEPLTKSDESAQEASTVAPASIANGQTVRVAVNTLETLMTTVSELVLTRNELFDFAERHGDAALAAPLERLSSVTLEMEHAVMKARMQPIARAWQKLPALVRTLSGTLGKHIELDMAGGDTELDRQVLEAIRDPLMHMVRNAVDHGVESPEERERLAKPRQARLCLSAYQDGGHIVVGLQDDGRGLDREAVLAKAIEKGLVQPSDIGQLSEEEIFDFVFQPGFSTAETVNEISGRGVGMDVVRSNVEAIGGTVRVETTSSAGTTFEIRIPLTLAIMPVLIVSARGMRFALPQYSVVELVRVGEATDVPIEVMNGAAVLNLRNKTLPLLDLGATLKLGETSWSELNSAEHTAVIVQVAKKRYALLVETVSHTKDIVVKPLSKLLRLAGVYSGNTIAGDGSIVMILDPAALMETLGALEEFDDSLPFAANGAAHGEKTALLLFRAGDSGAKAVQLSLIARLAQVNPNDIEMCNGVEVVQYDDDLLPLLRMSEGTRGEGRAVLPVLVFSDGHRCVGLVVDEILDVVEESLKLNRHTDSDGVAGAAIVGGQTVEVVDIAHYLEPLFCSGNEVEPAVPERPRLLLVDDVQFFRDMLSPLLQGSGYDVTVAASAPEALALLSDGNCFDIVVSDVEMPGMDGRELAKAIRARSEWNGLPLIALSSQPCPQLAASGGLGGFDACAGKFDRRSLMQLLGSWRHIREEAA